MTQRSLEITVISAKGLKKVKHLSKMDVYVTASVSGDHWTEQKTPVDKDGGTSPKWNHSMKFRIDETVAQMNHLFIIFKIKCDRTLRGDREIGEVRVAVKELLDNASEDNSPKYIMYPVRKPSGKQKGELNFMFRFGVGDKMGTGAIATAYPVHAATPSSIYPPPQNMAVPAYPPVGYQPPIQGGGYGYYPAQGGYTPTPTPPLPQQPPEGYPPVGPGYGYPPVVQPEKQNEFGGLGVGAAFVGGMLGALVVGDLVSEAAAAYEPGFDAGDIGC